MNSKDIERLFNEDMRDKKRTASGIHHKTGSRGYVGKMRFPTDIMSRKEKYNTRKAGKVESYNMNEILTKEEFLEKDKEMQKALLGNWRELYENEIIMDAMGIKGSNTYHKLIKELELPKKRRGGAHNFTGRRGKQKIVATTPEPITAPPIELQPFSIDNTFTQNKIREVKELKQPITNYFENNGLHLEYNGEYNADQLSKIFTKLQLLTDGEESKFTLNISLTERT